MRLNAYRATWLHWRKSFMLYAHATRLHRPFDLTLFLIPVLWLALLPTTNGGRDWGIVALLLAAVAVRSAAWLYNDLMDARHDARNAESFVARNLLVAREGWSLFFVLLGIAALVLMPWVGTLLVAFAAVALLLLLAYPFLKRRTLLTQPYLGFCFAWIVPMALPLLPGIEVKLVWLLFVAVCLWATAHVLLFSMQRHDLDERAGIGTLLQLLGDGTAMVVLALQLGAVVALWRIGVQAKLGWPYSAALLVALLTLIYQQWLLFRGGRAAAFRAYLSSNLFALVVLLGLLFQG